MELVLGGAADGRCYPDHLGAGAGILDRETVGPAGLVDVLETQLGLLGPAVPKAVRIAAYLAKLSDAGEGRFWSASFGMDAWSTADLLLGWRDTLVSGGWRGQPIGSRRGDALAAVEAAGDPLPPGLADRLLVVTAAVTSRPGLRLRRLTLLEPRDRLAPGLRKLVEAVEAAGVVVDQDLSAMGASDTGSDLSQAQAALAGREARPLSGDGSLIFMDADTSLMAAEAVADWIAAGAPEARAGTLVLAPDGDTALLDQALAARGLPVLGLSAPSPWRGVLQILPLAFAVAWRPFDPEALLGLLSSPRPPIPAFAARRLVRALVEAPGLHGAEWRRAWGDIEATMLAQRREAGESDPASAVAAQIAKWREWTDGGVLDRGAGVSVADARRIAARVAQWARELDAGAGDPLLSALAGAADAFIQAIERLRQDSMPALLVDRLVAQVLAEGVTNSSHVAEAGDLRAVRAPGAVCGPVARLVWWSFVGPGERPGLSPWSEAEAAAWRNAGVALELPAEAARRISEGYASVLQRITERVIFVRPAMSGTEPTVAHPLAHQLRPLTEPAGARVRWRAETLLDAAEVDLAGRTWTRQGLEVSDPPWPVAEWSAPDSVAERLATRRESATSLQGLLSCQLGWLAQSVLGLRPGRLSVLPSEHQLFGNLAHALASELLRPGPPPALAGFRLRAAQRLETLVPEIAAALLLPQHAADLEAARARVPAALEALVELLHDRGLEVVGAEVDREAEIDGLRLHGRLDLLVRRGAELGVVDLKWTRSAKRYLDEVAEGSAVQLAVYGAIVGGHPDVATGGYFLLRQQRLIAPAGSFLARDRIDAARGPAESFQAILGDWRAWRDLTTAGVALAAGVEGSAELRPAELDFGPAERPCRFCDLKGLCRIDVEAV